MGPLVPQFIGNEFNMIIALLIGIGFGFVLEQAGFSSTKKLVGLFYGYDFTVLRVFFTAGVTAMIGTLVLAHYGLLDMNVIYINPTFLYSALVGGVIMGVGFIIGGFCPGTSVCAAAVGKLDGLAFVFGSVLGIWFFSELYPYFKDIYLGEALGPLTMYQQLEISPKLWAFILTTIAIAAFYFTWLVENKVNGRKATYPAKQVRNYVLAGLAAFFFLFVVVFTPDRAEIIQTKIVAYQQEKADEVPTMAADKLAYEIINHYNTLNIIDVRSKELYKASHLPLAINIPFDDMLSRDWESMFKQNIKRNIFYADSDSLAELAYFKAQCVGNAKGFALKGNAEHFNSLFFNGNTFIAKTKREQEVFSFRKKAAKKMKAIEEKMKNASKPIKRKVKKVVGGCS